MVNVKPDPDDAFQHVSSGSRHIDELYLTTSRAYNHRSNWLSPSHSFHQDSRNQTTCKFSNTSTNWPIARQRFPDTRDAVVAPVLQENYSASRSPPVLEEYGRRRGPSPVEESSREAWGVEDDRSRQSPPPLTASSSVNNDPYRTVPGHHQAAELGVYRSGVDDSGASQGGLYQPRKLLTDFYRHRERQDHYQRQQQDAGEPVVEDRVMGESGRLVKSASACDGSPPAECQSAEATNFFSGRRQTWPFGTSVIPAMRRRQPQNPDQYIDHAEEDLDKVDRTANLQQSAGTTEAQ